MFYRPFVLFRLFQRQILFQREARGTDGEGVVPAHIPPVPRLEHHAGGGLTLLRPAQDEAVLGNSKRNITPQTARDRLAAFHFTGEDVFKSVSVLSGGELSRLKLCILMDEEVNLLILDEPTNHLDIASREWIEEAVESYDGTLLFVSHDRYFINRFATRVWELENGDITDYPMGFARYRQVKALEAQNKIDHTPKAVKEKTVTEKPKPNRSAQQARRQLTICEKEISAQETAIAEIEQRLEEAGGDYERYSEIYKEKEAAEETLGALMEKWESLAEQAGE